MNRTSNCVGVDGAKTGWIAVWWENDTLQHGFYDSPRVLVEAHRDARVIAVDIPIGLPERGRRRADTEARQFVGGRRACSIFSSPIRPILNATSQADASRRHREIDGRGFGAQAFAILSKIRDWDELLQADARVRAVVREIHPEVSFSALNGGRGKGLLSKKKSKEGAAIRMQLLSPQFGTEHLERLLQSMTHAQAAKDDVLDALVALWSAERIAQGVSISLPTSIDSDATGLPTAIWY